MAWDKADCPLGRGIDASERVDWLVLDLLTRWW